MSREKFDAYREREKFDALIRESPINREPYANIHDHEIGKRATEYIHAAEDRRRVLRNEMFDIEEEQRQELETARKAAAKARRKARKTEQPPPERTPMQQLCVDLIEASCERASLKVAPPDALMSVPNHPVPLSGMSSGALHALRQSLDQSREDCAGAPR